MPSRGGNPRPSGRGACRRGPRPGERASFIAARDAHSPGLDDATDVCGYDRPLAGRWLHPTTERGGGRFDPPPTADAGRTSEGNRDCRCISELSRLAGTWPMRAVISIESYVTNTAMNMPQIILGFHLLIAAVFVVFGVSAGTSGNPVQLVILSSIAAMIGLLGRSAARIAARR